MNPFTVQRVSRLYEETGTVISVQGYHACTTQKLTTQDEINLIEAIVESPSKYLHELGEFIYLQVQMFVRPLFTITLVSKESLSFRAQQRNEQKRSLFQEEISLLDPHMFVFVDESGTDKLQSLRKYSYSLKGTRAVTVKKLVKGQWLSAIS